VARATASTTSGPVAVVIPTLNRIADLRACVESVAAQTRAPDLVLVVDNGSTDGTRDFLGRTDGLTPLLQERNAGAPGGFEIGVREAIARGAEWIWLLDDDAVAAPTALAELMGRATTASGPIGGLAPTVEFGDGRRETGWLWGARATSELGQSPNVPDDQGETPAQDVDWAPFAGLMLTRAACEQVGAIRADYVLWHADVEYCLRLRIAGFQLLAAPEALVRHPAMPMISRRIVGRTVTVGRIAPWREYYDTRNRWLLARTVRGTAFERRVAPIARARDELARAVAVLLADPGGTRRLWMRALGAVDGARGRITRRPEAR